MRLSEITDETEIDEIEDDYFDDITYELIDNLKQYCKQYIQMNPDHLNTRLYRGADINDEYYEEISPPINRIPKDMPVEMSKILDIGLQLAGFDTYRSNSIFCSGIASQASQYGPINVVYPMDGFKFLYSPYFVDLYSQRAQVFSKILKPAIKNLDELEKHYDFEDIFYYSNSSSTINEIIESSEFDQYILEKTFKDHFTNENLTDGMRTGEILISKSDCYIIDAEFFTDHVIPNWQ